MVKTAPQPKADYIICRICDNVRARWRDDVGRICSPECFAVVNAAKKARFRAKLENLAKEAAYMRRYMPVWKARRFPDAKRKAFFRKRMLELLRQVAKWDLECAKLERKAARAERRRGRRAVERLRKSIGKSLGGAGKSAATAAIVGYPLSELREWAVRNGYNPPETHIDHIVPVSWWLERYPGDFRRAMRGAWNLGNLRVVSASDNLAKGAKREFLV